MLNYHYYIWVDISANKTRITNENYFKNILKKCAESGIGSVIMSVKDPSGFCIHNSKIAPHYSNYNSIFKKDDYLLKYIDFAHDLGLKIYAAVDMFSEGHTRDCHPMAPGVIHKDWQTHLYGLSNDNTPCIQSTADKKPIKTIGSIDDFHEIFVNPIHEEVQNYELSIIEELCKNYKIDGIVLDRARFVGISADFSDYSKAKFEEFINRNVENWPEDIYKLHQTENGIEMEYGALFGDWLTFRASYIKQFILKAKETIKTVNEKLEFVDYTGSWYPIYYLVGANWASEKYIPDEYPWVNGSEYSKTGYAEHLDTLLSGFYYPEVTKEEVKSKNNAFWYSVEGSGDILKKTVKDAVPYIGSLFLLQYANDKEQFKKAVDMCFKKTAGCMLFDLCYIDDYNWWDLCKREEN